MTAAIQPTIVIDSREQIPLVFTRFPSITGTLRTGDYSIAGMEELFAVERKTVADLIGCCVGDNRDRFERELHRLRGYRFKRLLIVGSRSEIERHDYRSNIKPQSVLGSLSAWEIRFDVPVVFSPSPTEAATQVERWAHYHVHEYFKTADAIQRKSR